MSDDVSWRLADRRSLRDEPPVTDVEERMFEARMDGIFGPERSLEAFGRHLLR
jgi:hypothetical protein